MRSISILVMVLFISTSASATVQIGINGLISSSDITIAPLQIRSISIWTTTLLSEPTYYVLGVTEGDPGTIDGTEPWFHAGVELWPVEESPVPGFSSYVTVVYHEVDTLPAGSLLVDNIAFRCDGLGDVSLLLLESPDGLNWTLNDSQTIHQIPEPGTIALLGLGAMLLKRRR